MTARIDRNLHGGWRMSKKIVYCLMIGIAVFVFAPGCSDDDDNGTEPTPVDQFEVVRSALNDWIANATPTMSAATLYENLYEDGNPNNDPFVLSVRSEDHYLNRGHIPDALNIPWRQVGDPAELTILPNDRQIVAYCYTGHTGQLATTALGAMGYDVTNLKFGMTAWTSVDSVRVAAAFDDDAVIDYGFETTTNNFTETYDLPELDVTDSENEMTIIQEAYEEAWGGSAGPTISAQALKDNLDDGNANNDPMILSVRSADHYAIGHIQGAYNIPWRTIMDPDNLEKLPTDQQIVVYCYTGHTGQVATAALRMLGYDAVNLKFGIMAWTTDPDVRVAAPFSEDDVVDYPVETGPPTF
ncbi:MAG: hypothetical protein GF346_11655 [Candidatus Eisenbacteria bacterium]|nr:hypothetical protein [Candidatus Latescibacterota bacterium]MBD3303092.1 hypothetical protein [Candidatus Eisenbacteria bacterium]